MVQAATSSCCVIAACKCYPCLVECGTCQPWAFIVIKQHGGSQVLEVLPATAAMASNACLANPSRLVGSSSVQSLSHKHGRCVPSHTTVANTTTARGQGCAAASGALSAACGLIGSSSMADWEHWHLCATTHLCVHTWKPGASAHTVAGMQRGADICSTAAAAVGRCEFTCTVCFEVPVACCHVSCGMLAIGWRQRQLVPAGKHTYLWSQQCWCCCQAAACVWPLLALSSVNRSVDRLWQHGGWHPWCAPRGAHLSLAGHCSCAVHPHCGFELNMGAGQQWVHQDAVAMHHDDISGNPWVTRDGHLSLAATLRLVH